MKINIIALIGFFLLIISCSKKQYEVEKDIIVKTNFTISQDYSVDIKTENNALINIGIYNPSGNKLEKITFGNSTVELLLKTKTVKTPFKLIKPFVVTGNMVFTPQSGKGKTFLIPFYLKINPWIITNFWIVIILLTIITIGFIINFIMLIVLSPVEGTIHFSTPSDLIYPLYPPSLFFHFRRNITTIGTFRDNKYFISDKVCDNMPSFSIELFFHRNKITLNIAENGFSIFYKESALLRNIKIQNSQNTSIWVPDYTIDRNQNIDELLNRGYHKQKDHEEIYIDKNNEYLFILFRRNEIEIIFTFSTKKY